MAAPLTHPQLKVLLLGEFSGLHGSLKDGLAHLDVQADIASDGDGWKGFPVDLNFVSPFSPTTAAGRIFKNLKPFYFLNQFRDYDLVQLVNPLILTPRLGLNELFVELALKRARRLFLLGAGDDAYYYEALKGFKYSPLADYKRIDLGGGCTPHESASMQRLNRRIVDRADGILPVAFDYWAGYANHPKVHPVIPMPINTDRYPYQENRVQSRLVFYHGINRPGFKGSRYIIEAFDRMRARFDREAEFIVADRLPIGEYLAILERVNVIVDQSLSYSYGMNALIAMAMGKVVMSGSEEEILPIYGEADHPVINIKPDVDQICQQIEWLITNRDQIPQMGARSRDFVVRQHSHIKVAGQFLEAWTGRNLSGGPGLVP